MEKILVQGINLLVQIILARILLPSDFGNLAIIVAITNYAAIFVQSGVATVIIQRKDINDVDISTLFISSMSFALLLFLGLFFAAPYISIIYKTNDLIWPLRILAIVLFLNSINAIQTGIYSKRMEFKKMFIRSIIAVPVSGAIGIIMALKGFGLWSLVVHNIVNMLLIVLIMAFDKTTWFKFGFSFESFKKLYSFTGKIILTSVVTGGSDLLRTLLIGKKYSTDDLAYYDKAYTYSNYATQIVGQSVTSVALPTFSKMQDDKQKLKETVRKSVSLSAFIMFPVLLGFASVSDSFVKLVLTDKWAACVPFLIIFCFLRMPSFVCSIDKQAYFALGKSEINLFYEIGFLVINLAMLFICIQFGVIWIAIGAAVIEWIGCICLFFVSKNVYGYSLKERLGDLWRPLLNSCIMFGTTYSIRFLLSSVILKLIIQVIAGVFVYFLLSLITFDKNIGYIADIFKKK